mmetsp:Transcript_156350/g.501611  ORF Transcript_156350/g.501611 Transcript_156350/m.501611 type:complete len:82 (+) Transcript_156350:316-561(+)
MLTCSPDGIVPRIWSRIVADERTSERRDARSFGRILKNDTLQRTSVAPLVDRAAFDDEFHTCSGEVERLAQRQGLAPLVSF